MTSDENTQEQPGGDWDKTEIFESEVLPLIEQLYALCEQHGIGLVAATCYAKTRKEEGGSYACSLAATVDDQQHSPDLNFAANILKDQGNFMIAIKGLHWAESLRQFAATCPSFLPKRGAE